MTITKQELADGIRFAGQRAAAAARYARDWDHHLGHHWTTREAFAHIAATAPGLPQFYPLLETGVLSGMKADQAAAANDRAINQLEQKSKDEIIQAIIEGHEQSARFVEGLDDADLAKVVTLGGYEMPKAEIVAQIWIHHAIAHAYEASARWPLT